jgi:inner membrane protein
MHRSGHLGAAGVAYAPLFFWLLGEGQVLAAVLGLGATVVTAGLPDADLRIPGLAHRGATHTLLFAVLAAAGAGGLCLSLGMGRFLSAVVAGSTLLSVVSHLVADGMTPMGIRPFRPLSAARVKLPPGVLSRSPLANGLSLVLGAGAIAGVAYSNGTVIMQSTFRTMGFGTSDISTPDSPAEWEVFVDSSVEMGLTVLLTILRFDYIGVAMMVAMVLTGTIVAWKS